MFPIPFATGRSAVRPFRDGRYRPRLEVLEARRLLSFTTLAPFSNNGSIYTWQPAVGDFNNDGNQDLVVADNLGYCVNVFQGNGDGTFGPALRLPTPGTPTEVAVGDLNNDGNLDIVAADYNTGQVSVFLGNGDGTFQPAQNYTATPLSYTVVLGDFANAGNLDIASSGYGPTASQVAVLLNNGDGTFQPAVYYPAGTSDYQLTTADFNGDGNLDLATAAYHDGLYVLLGNGDGTFQAPLRSPANPEAWRLTAGDLNNDGIPDIITANFGTDDVSVQLGNGDGTFQDPVELADAGGSSVALSDFNLDGNLDVVAVPRNGSTVSVFLGNGDGTFGDAQMYAAGSSTIYVATGDFNNDGYPDIVVTGNTTGTITILLNNADWGNPPAGRSDPRVKVSPSAAQSATRAGAPLQAIDAVHSTPVKALGTIPLNPIFKQASGGNWLDAATAELVE